MTATRRLHRDVAVPTVIVAELYRGGGRNQMIDSLLSRETEALELRDTDRVLARLVGAVLAAAPSRPEDLADTHVIATVVEAGGGVVITSTQQTSIASLIRTERSSSNS